MNRTLQRKERPIRNSIKLTTAGIGLSLGLGGLEASFNEKPQESLQTVEIPSNTVVYAGNVAMEASEIIVETITSTPPTSDVLILDKAATANVYADRGEAIQVTDTIPPPPPPLPRWYSTWLRVADCESGDIDIPGSANWYINTSNGFDGGLQFEPDSWRGAGGLKYAPYAHLATPLQQIEIANKLWDMQGWNAWPSCSRQLGLR